MLIEMTLDDPFTLSIYMEFVSPTLLVNVSILSRKRPVLQDNIIPNELAISTSLTFPRGSKVSELSMYLYENDCITKQPDDLHTCQSLL